MYVICFDLGSDWSILKTNVFKVDVGYGGVWVLDTAGRVFYRKGTYDDPGTTGKGRNFLKRCSREGRNSIVLVVFV